MSYFFLISMIKIMDRSAGYDSLTTLIWNTRGTCNNRISLTTLLNLQTLFILPSSKQWECLHLTTLSGNHIPRLLKLCTSSPLNLTFTSCRLAATLHTHSKNLPHLLLSHALSRTKPPTETPLCKRVYEAPKDTVSQYEISETKFGKQK